MKQGLGGEQLSKFKTSVMLKGILMESNKGKCTISSREELGKAYNPLRAKTSSE